MNANAVHLIQVTPEQLSLTVKEAIREELQTLQASLEKKKTKRTEYITRKEVAKMLGISKPTLWRWEKNRTLKNYKVQGRVFYKLHEVQELISKSVNHEEA